MQAGVPVLMEKPFVLMGQLAEATGTPREQSLLMIDFNRRFWRPYQRIAEMVRNGALGRSTARSSRCRWTCARGVQSPPTVSIRRKEVRCSTWGARWSTWRSG